MTALLLIAIAFAVLWVWWQILDLTFDAIEQWHESLRDQQHEQARADGSAEAAPATRERGN